jgi:hypothetical protein
MISGKAGSFKIGSTTYQTISFSISETGGTIDVTSSDDAASAYKKKVPQKHISWGGTVEGFYKNGEVSPALHTVVTTGEFIADSNTKWTGDFTIVSKNFDVPVVGDDYCKFSMQIEGLGVLTEANAA